MPTYRCDHVHLKAREIESSARWYVEMLGAKITFEGAFKGSKVYYLEIAGFNLVMYSLLEGEVGAGAPIEPTLQARYGVDHFGFAVDDLERAVAELESKGVVILERPWSPRRGVAISYIQGPDMVRIELTERNPMPQTAGLNGAVKTAVTS